MRWGETGLQDVASWIFSHWRGGSGFFLHTPIWVSPEERGNIAEFPNRTVIAEFPNQCWLSLINKIYIDFPPRLTTSTSLSSLECLTKRASHTQVKLNMLISPMICSSLVGMQRGTKNRSSNSRRVFLWDTDSLHRHPGQQVCLQRGSKVFVEVHWCRFTVSKVSVVFSEQIAIYSTQQTIIYCSRPGVVICLNCLVGLLYNITYGGHGGHVVLALAPLPQF